MANQRKRANQKRPVRRTLTFYLDAEVVDAYNETILADNSAAIALERAKRHHDEVADSAQEAVGPEGEIPAGLARQIAEAVANLAEAQEAKTQAEARMAEAKDAMEAERFPVTLQAIPRKLFYDMLADHPPTEEQVVKAYQMAEEAGLLEEMTEAQRKKVRLEFNPDTWPMALVKACAVDLDEDEIEYIFDVTGTWAQEDATAIFNAAGEVCQKASLLRR